MQLTDQCQPQLKSPPGAPGCSEALRFWLRCKQSCGFNCCHCLSQNISIPLFFICIHLLRILTSLCFTVNDGHVFASSTCQHTSLLPPRCTLTLAAAKNRGFQGGSGEFQSVQFSDVCSENTSGPLTDLHDAIGNMSVNFWNRVLLLCSLDAVLTAGWSNWLSAQYSHSTVIVVATLLCLLLSSKPSWLPGEEHFGSFSQFHSSLDLNLPVVYPRAHFISAVLVQIQRFRLSINVLSCKQLETAGFSGREHNAALIPVTAPL